MYSRPQIPLSGTLGWHQKGMLNSSCASSRAAGMVEGSPDSSPSGRRQWDASRWANGLATVLTPIIISQTSLQHPTDSQTSQSSGLQTEQRRDRGLSQLCVANGINLCWTGSQENRVGGARTDDDEGRKQDVSPATVIMTTEHQYYNKWTEKYLILEMFNTCFTICEQKLHFNSREKLQMANQLK